MMQRIRMTNDQISMTNLLDIGHWNLVIGAFRVVPSCLTSINKSLFVKRSLTGRIIECGERPSNSVGISVREMQILSRTETSTLALLRVRTPVIVKLEES